ncbi:MAG: phosphoenolpyruvate protein kinase [Acidobacteria bacterium]|nr:MAG: phosphoenolpyruvate protein kinase [Acidobacteriota bacterium]PYR74918.1 MAG: phosphoenolpyruvate protein kinase [Acidobacteriota bacterium]
MADWLALATSASVVRRATVVAIVVGTILVVINHGDAIVRGDLGVGRLLRIGLTVVVPYCVSTYSSVSALRAAARRAREEAVS